MRTTRACTRNIPLATVAGQVFDTAELLENIILCLPLRELFTVQRVSKTWKATSDNSVKVQRAMFLLPVPFKPGDKLEDCVVNPLLAASAYVPTKLPRPRCDHKILCLERPSSVTIEDADRDKTTYFAFDFQFHSFKRWILPEPTPHIWDRRPLRPYNRKEDSQSWRKMLLSQPLPPASSRKVEYDALDGAWSSRKAGLDGQEGNRCTTLGQCFEELEEDYMELSWGD